MKNAVMAFLIALGLVAVYSIVILIISPLISGDVASPPYYLLLPVLFPWIIFENIAPESLLNAIHASPMILLVRMVFALSSAFVYAIPIYLLMKFRSKS